MEDSQRKKIQDLVREIPDFPKSGILFRDITPVLADADALAACVDVFAAEFEASRPDVVVGIESRGFIFGAPLAVRLGAGFVPARKPGKLPHETQKVTYALEYGTDAIEMHVDAIVRGARVLLVDDLIATGGTAQATCELVRRAGGELLAAAFLIELTALEGVKKLAPVRTYSVLKY